MVIVLTGRDTYGVPVKVYVKVVFQNAGGQLWHNNITRMALNISSSLVEQTSLPYAD